MNIIDKKGRRPDEVIEHDNGDITYRYALDHFRYAVDGVYVTSQSNDETRSHGLECRLNPDDTIEQFSFAESWAYLAIPGDEPLYELGRELTNVGGDLTPSGHADRKTGMSLWFEIPKVWVHFQMDGDLIKMEDCFTGDHYWAQTVEGALERLTWLIERTADEDLWQAINEAKEQILARDAELYVEDEETETNEEEN